MSRNLRAALILFLLAPLIGEYVLGNIPLSEIGALIVLAPLYGGGALLIREVVRRTGRGWPTILTLGLAYGVLEAGLLDQSLFNPAFEEHHFQAVTPIPALGISALNGYSFVVGHAVWSIGVPIALVESLAWRRRTTPWLGRTGLIVLSVVFIAGSALVFRILLRQEDFMATPAQRIGAATVVLALIAIAFLFRPRTTADRRVPGPGPLGIGAFLVSSIFVAVPENWTGFGLKIALTIVAATALTWWGRGTTWGAAHRFAVAAGALVTYTWLGWILVEKSPGPLIAHAVLVLVTWAFLFVVRQPSIRGDS
ncbi:hypothetical protein ADK67_46130 [Saccharothrix sp. NRRL B-16348]|uniref:hypothetical protein n=1 Tax=Saccharothrix sp. NRRL B-16348 TaxID=1415542 RepID=UPI0006AFB2C5|nr:hypothetical protein [Saccharothrix sp. NRRL B-16348]KOX12919.1 hypothetical protein ADK67_46130 [Saccharothrix sp. NRRL B-16348]